MKEMLKAVVVFAVAVSLAGCQSSTEAAPQGGAVSTASTVEELGRHFVTAAAAGDSERIQDMYITRDEFAATFRGTDLHTLYESIRGQFENSLGRVLPELTGARFVRMNVHLLTVEPGTNFGLVEFAVATLATDNIRVIADVDGAEQEVKLDALVNVGETWRLLSPVSLVPKR